MRDTLLSQRMIVLTKECGLGRQTGQRVRHKDPDVLHHPLKFIRITHNARRVHKLGGRKRSRRETKGRKMEGRSTEPLQTSSFIERHQHSSRSRIHAGYHAGIEEAQPNPG